MTAAEMEAGEQFLSVMFVGDSGSGKTTAGMTFPGERHIIDLDYRARGAFNPSTHSLTDRENTQIFQFAPTQYGFDGLMVHIDNYGKILRSKGRAGLPKVVQLDSGGALTNLLLAAAKEITKGGEKFEVNGHTYTLAGPKDFGFEVGMLKQMLDRLKILPITFILSCHVQDKYGRPPGLPFAPNIVIGEKLTMRDGVGETTLGMFNDVFRFKRVEVNNQVRHLVNFVDGFCAKNSWGIPPGEHNYTGIKFYDYFEELKKSPTASWQTIWKTLGKEVK